MSDNNELNELSSVEQEAFSLSRAAVLLDQARSNRASAPEELAGALDNNLELWVTIRTLVAKEGNSMPAAVKENLTKLSHFVADQTLSKGAEIDDQAIDTLININLQISEGLLEGQKGTS